MDPFAHLAAGALMGRAVRPTGEAWPAFALFGLAAGLSPDVDAPLALLGADVWGRWHQLFTHSLIGLLWVPLALSLLPFSFAPWKTRFALALGGWLLHVSLDLVARWPVPLLWPASDEKWALFLLERDFSWTIDMLLILGLAASLWDPARPYTRWIVLATASVVAGWLVGGLPT